MPSFSMTDPKGHIVNLVANDAVSLRALVIKKCLVADKRLRWVPNCAEASAIVAAEVAAREAAATSEQGVRDTARAKLTIIEQRALGLIK